MSKYEEALKNLSYDVHRLCKEMGWEMDSKDIEIMKELIKEKSDLEAKLAESEKKNFELMTKLNLKEHKPAFCTLADRDCEALGQVEELKQQLAEKDEEIENLNNRILISQLQAPKEQILNILGSQCIQYNPDQDKISFAVEQLEKVKECLYKIQSPIGEKPTLMDDGDVFEVINNQIKQLKEMK